MQVQGGTRWHRRRRERGTRVARTGTLGPALALHFTNNVFAILVTAPAGNLDGIALYTFPLALEEEGLAWYVLPIEILFTLCAWLTARIALRR